MFFPLLSLTTLAFSTGTTAAPAPDQALTRAIGAANTLQSWYNSATGTWDTCGWWNGANCMTTLANLAALDLDDGTRGIAEGVFQNTFAVAPNVNPYPERGAAVKYTSKNGEAFEDQHQDEGEVPTGAANASLWLDGSYDDDAWWGLAWVAAYDVTGQKDYLDLAEGLFYHLSNSWPSKCGGGIDSDSTHVYVGAIANELFLALAAGLANRADDSAYYLDWAKRQWTWFSDIGFINDEYTINDGLMDDCTNNGDTVWTYNQGVILGGLVELHRASGADSSNSTYLDEAEKIAKGAIAALTDDDHVVRESCEPDGCGADQTQFKGSFIRNLRALHAVAPDDAYAKVIKASADSLWKNDRTDGDKFGVDWSGPVDGDKVDASTHSSAMDALVAAIQA